MAGHPRASVKFGLRTKLRMGVREIGFWGLGLELEFGIWNRSSRCLCWEYLLCVGPFAGAGRLVVILCNCAKEAGDENWERIETVHTSGRW
jgi:hypothetical protein